MQTKNEAQKIIANLVNRFSEQKDFYKKSDYNETLTRRDFIDPFFEALGWDVANKQGYAESYREVIHEDKIKVRENGGEKTKAPDYAFRLGGGKRLFFVEAKKPSVYVKDEILPAYQVRRYGWSAKMPISVITDFEEFAIYDCTKKPSPTDKASIARIKYLTYDNYLNEFDFIWNTFSKERVLKGSFDSFVKSDTHKKGTATVDSEFLQSLDRWRTYLAANISINNKNLNEEELNFVVQQTIDRIIFLRIAEDRGLEHEKYIEGVITYGKNYYQDLYDRFVSADAKYNSGLFNFKKDKISSKVIIDNKVIKSIVEELYYPKCEYEFSVMPVEILGTAYEQFLGKTITIDKNHKAKIEEKPEVRKAGGVYYTPQYIVDYIVKNTVGKLAPLNPPKGGKPVLPSDVSKIKICDPACGSGSFLLGAYSYLLQWHLDYYTQNPAAAKKDKALTPTGALVTALKKQILLNNIFGVDIDVNAVEVTKLSLLLKCTEGETEASIKSQLQLDRILPTLDDNIKSGNSLIDLDYYDNELDFGEEKKVKPFSWQKAFPEVFKQGGFDCVIGNPPYFRVEAERPESNYLRTKYSTAEFKLDIYTLFVEKFVKEGFKKFGFIIPNTLLTNLTDKKLRKLLLEKSTIDEIVNYRIKVFQDAVVHSMILILSDNLENEKIKITEVSPDKTEIFEVEKKRFIENENYSFDFRMFGKNAGLFEKLNSQSVVLSNLCEVKQTIKTGNDEKYISTKKEKANFKKVIGGSEIQRYQLNYKGRYVNYGSYLACPRNPHIFEVNEKILIRETGKQITATYDNEQYYILSSLYSVFLKENLSYNLKYILGVINSNLSQFFMKQLCFDNSSGAFVKARIFHYQQLPIKTINFKSDEKIKHNEIVKNVDLLLQLNKEKHETKLESKIEQLQNRIDYCEQKINELVYYLYGLTEEEIKIVEKK